MPSFSGAPSTSDPPGLPQQHTQRSILLFWSPLAATWVMMATEGPFLAAVIARLPDPTFNLAAYGVAFALAIVVEAPVMMLMSAATALVKDRASFRKLRTFSRALAAATTAFLLLLLAPGVYGWLTGTVMALPPEVAELTRGALWFFLPWPGAIAYRRFLQGVLIRSGKTRLVAYGTVVRLIAMSVTALAAYSLLDVPGAWVGGLALSTGVVVEALAARVMAASTVRELLAGQHDRPGAQEIGYGEIASFYLPLALTSLIGLTVQPMLTFFMARSVAPVQSLAVFPVVHALGFFFRSMGLAFQDAAIALMGVRYEHLRALGRFAATLGFATSLAIALVAFTPLSHFYFVTISGLTPELTRFALVPARLLVPLPGLTALLALQRAILVEGRRTRLITAASAVEVGTIGIVFTVLAWGLDLVGATAAFAAFTVGRTCSNGYLAFWCRRVLDKDRRPSRA
jgi:Na+-driven multidrug efflux pump